MSNLKWLLLFLLCVNLHGEIRKASSFQTISEELAKADKETIIFLDVGETLITARDPILHPGNAEWKKEWLQTHFPNLSSAERVQLAHIIKSDKSLWKLVDPAWPKLISQTEKKGAKLVPIIKMYDNPQFQGLTLAVLHHLNLKFKPSLRDLQSGISFTYKDGILETSSLSKGPVIAEVMTKLNPRPKKVIFIDDNLEQIKSVEQALSAEKIPCLALHLIFNQAPPFDAPIAEAQLRTLVEEHRWVSEDEVKDEEF
jgi:hypothetical protein